MFSNVCISFKNAAVRSRHAGALSPLARPGRGLALRRGTGRAPHGTPTRARVSGHVSRGRGCGGAVLTCARVIAFTALLHRGSFDFGPRRRFADPRSDGVGAPGAAGQWRLCHAERGAGLAASHFEFAAMDRVAKLAGTTMEVAGTLTEKTKSRKKHCQGRPARQRFGREMLKHYSGGTFPVVFWKQQPCEEIVFQICIAETLFRDGTSDPPWLYAEHVRVVRNYFGVLTHSNLVTHLWILKGSGGP